MTTFELTLDEVLQLAKTAKKNGSTMLIARGTRGEKAIIHVAGEEPYVPGPETDRES